jgi:hypothetical protein
MAEKLGMDEVTAATDNLFAGTPGQYPEIPVEIAAGEGALKRGTVLGKITKGAISIVAKTGNTGNGLPGAITIGQMAQPGEYTLKCITAASNAGTFAVYDPQGRRMADLTANVDYDNGHFKVRIADGSADFAVGDTFTVTVAAGSGKYRAYDDDNTDGTDIARVILGRDIDATTIAVKAFAYAGGLFRRSALTGIDDAAVADLADRGVFVK